MSWRFTSPKNSGKWTHRLLKVPEKSVARARPRASMGWVASLRAARVSWYSFCQQVSPRTHRAHTLSAARVKISAGFSVFRSSGRRVSFTLP